MPKNDLWERRLKQFQTPRAAQIKSRLDEIADKKSVSNKSRTKLLTPRRLQLYTSVALGLVSGYFGYKALINPTSNMQTGETKLVEPEIINSINDLLSDSERYTLEQALADFYDRFGIIGINLNIIPSRFGGTLESQEIYSSSGELQIDIDLIRAKAAEKGMPIEEYFRLTLLDSLSPTLQSPGSAFLPETTEVYIDEGYRLIGYTGFRALVDAGGGHVADLFDAEALFRNAFANAVDPSYAIRFNKVEQVKFVHLLLAQYGISIEEALDFNRIHGPDHLLLRMFRDRNLNEAGAPAITIEDIDEFYAFFELANQEGADAEQLFRRYVRVANQQDFNEQ